MYVEKFGPQNTDALLGGFKCLERLKENEEILDSFQEIHQLFSTFFPLHIEKCKIFLNIGDYENAIDYIRTKVNIKHFEIYKVLSVCNLVYEGDFNSASDNIDKFSELLISQEPKNPELYYESAKLFSRICDKKVEIIKKCENMIDRALSFAPRNAKYLIEKGHYRLIYGDVDNAIKIFTSASESDVNNKESAYGYIFCKIIKNQLKEAQEYIELLKETFSSIQIPIHPKLIYYDGLIRFIQGEKEERIVEIVIEALNTHVKLAKSQILNKYDSLIATEYDFLFDLAKSK
jgi:tetratricopeptide (TPR) repeat protein